MIQENVSLKPYNTFGVEASTRYFAEVGSLESLTEILGWHRNQTDVPLLILGGGSNLLFTKNWPGLVLKLDLFEKTLVKEDKESVLVSAGAGENWHDFVMWTLEQGWNGLENLSLIPGNVGASPMQNIGAYGVETKNVFSSLKAVNIKTGALKIFTAAECRFGYRESVFKNKEKDRWIIISVTFKLRTDGKVNVDYGTIKAVLEAHKIKNPTPRQVSQAVTAIRQAKLPDPKVLGSAGSFFKNPVISSRQLLDLKNLLPDVPHYEVSPHEFKVPAGYLIEQAGWKGKTFDNYGVHKEQALVLVNYGGATGSEIWQLAKDMQDSVETDYGVVLQPEVNVI